MTAAPTLGSRSVTERPDQPAVSTTRALRGATTFDVDVRLSMLKLAGRWLGGPLVAEVAGAGAVSLDLYFDTLSAVMLLLVSFLGAVVMRYSGNYLAGDPRQGCFIKWLGVTIGAKGRAWTSPRIRPRSGWAISRDGAGCGT